jgi:tetratricopeptide (TPR) repeat protein
LFATPPTATFEDALKNFVKSEELAVSFDKPTIRNRLFIADSYSNLKQYDSAKQWFKKALELNPANEVDKNLQKEATTKLSKL